MSEARITPSLRTANLAALVDFYVQGLRFTVNRAGEDNTSLGFGENHIMIEGPFGFYSAPYNAAIRARLGTPSAHALYIEATDLHALYERATNARLKVIDPLAPRPWGQSEFTVEDPDGNWICFWAALS